MCMCSEVPALNRPMAKVTHLAISFPHQTPKSGIERWAVQQTCDILHLRLELAYVIVTTDNPLGTAAFLPLRKKVLVLCNNRCLCTLSFQRLNFLNLLLRLFVMEQPEIVD